ncbi:MAG: response regulator, partial [Chitinophagales bacterium]|nr:response regulator [Chitinophagales bacterium]
AFNEQIVIKVLDNGPGISAENKNLVFEKYYRVNQTGKIVGSGIGLSFVKELVELLGGTIDINSKEQVGTTFTVRIPFTNAKNADVSSNEIFDLQETKVIPISSDFIEKSQSKKPVLLVVEDNSDIQKLIAEIFHHDYKVVRAENGSEGLKLVRSIVPDMVITDVMMPIMDGFEMCDQIKADNTINHIPIVMLTAKVGIQNRVKGMNMGADAYLAKPFSVAELKSMVENIQTQRAKLRNHYAHNPLFTGSEEMVSADVVFVKSATNEVMKNIENEKYGVEDLASSFNMSRYTLIRKFKSVLNNTPNDFIQKIRLEMAKTMLEKKVASISEIAYKVGFASVTYFSSSFKKEFGMSPRDFMQDKNGH